jgi:predicted RNase H-like nuclease (RuvC/YqgF family)
LSGDVEEWDAKSVAEPQLPPASADGERIAHLEKEVAELRNDVADFQKEIADLKEEFAQFRKQFE